MIEFDETEAEFVERDGRLIVRIAAEVIRRKLPKAGRVKAAVLPYATKEEADEAYFPRFEGISVLQLSRWIGLHLEGLKSGHTLSVYVRMLEELRELYGQYGTGAFSEALSRCREPRQCTVSYLKAILRNNRTPKGENHVTAITGESEHRQAIGAALRQFV